MELRHLRYFLAVAESLNFSRAAGKLRVAQPALSRQIQDLESEVRVRLFERSTSRVRLTEAGEYFRQHVEKILSQVDLAVTGAQQVAKSARGNFKIGSDWNAAGLPVATAARALQKRYSQLAVDFVEIPGHEHTDAVRARKIDVGFIPVQMLGSRGEVAFARVCTCEYKAVLPATHTLATAPALRVRDLKDERWLVLAEKEIPGFKVFFTQILRPAQFTPKFGRIAHSLPGMLAFISTGEGVTMIPELFLPPTPEGVRYIATDCAPFELFAVWSKSEPSTHVAAFLEILQEKMAAKSPVPPPAQVSVRPTAKVAALRRRTKAKP